MTAPRAQVQLPKRLQHSSAAAQDLKRNCAAPEAAPNFTSMLTTSCSKPAPASKVFKLLSLQSSVGKPSITTTHKHR